MDLRTCSECSLALPANTFPPRGYRCLPCRRAAGRRRYRENTAYYVAKARTRNARVIKEIRVWVADYLRDHPCVDCGLSDIRTLEFDHRDTGTKSAAVAVLARNGYSLRRVQTEIALCDVRCANCHRIRTHKQRGWWGALLTEQGRGATYAEGPRASTPMRDEGP